MYLFQFHSKLTIYFFFVPTLYQNHVIRFHGFWQRCIASWMFYLFRYCPNRSLTGCWVDHRAAASALVSTDFHSKLRITLYFFDLKDLIYSYLHVLTRCCSQNVAWISWRFSYAMLSWASGKTLFGVFSVQCSHRSIQTILHRILS